jgi:hypothetical protein
VLDGSWEEAIAHLQKAEFAAAENLKVSESTFGRIRKDHESKVVEWRETITRQEQRLKDIEAEQQRAGAHHRKRRTAQLTPPP